MKKVTQKPLKAVGKKVKAVQKTAKKDVKAVKKVARQEVKAVKKAVTKISPQAHREQENILTIIFLIGVIIFFLLLLLISKNILC